MFCESLTKYLMTEFSNFVKFLLSVSFVKDYSVLVGYTVLKKMPNIKITTKK